MHCQQNVKNLWKCHTGKTELYNSSIYYYIVLNITYFFPPLCTWGDPKKKQDFFMSD